MVRTGKWNIAVSAFDSIDGGCIVILRDGTTVSVELTLEQLDALAFEVSAAAEDARRRADERLNKEIEQLDTKYRHDPA